MTNGDALIDFAIWRPGRPDGVDDLHRGRRHCARSRHGRGLRGAGWRRWLSAGHRKRDGCHSGDILGVRITRAAQGGKGPRLTAALNATEQALIGRGPPALVRRGPGALLRLAAQYPDAR